TIVALRGRTEEIKRREVDKVLARLAHLSPEDRAAVEALASAIVNKMVHGTMVTLKAEATSSSGAAYVDAARRFFSLEDAPAAYPPAQTEVQEVSEDSSDGNGANRFSEASLVQHTTKEQSRRVS
ncbi:MAG TPA: glutamyl-tRNA reductase, partial [Nitrospira sp.]|nr:glutamyl-tRNA reductase [Nitrospira sp.]